MQLYLVAFKKLFVIIFAFIFKFGSGFGIVNLLSNYYCILNISFLMRQSHFYSIKYLSSLTIPPNQVKIIITFRTHTLKGR